MKSNRRIAPTIGVVVFVLITVTTAGTLLAIDVQ